MKALLAGIALLVVLGVGFLLYSSPTAPAEMTDADRQAVAEEIHQAGLEFFATGPANDLEAAMALYLDDTAEYFVGEPAVFQNRLSLLRTKADVIRVYEPALANRSATNYSVTDEFIAVLSADHAVQVFEATFNITDTEGVTGPDYPMAGSVVWVRQEGKWKILHYHQSWSTDIE